jgi:hypothetical protein
MTAVKALLVTVVVFLAAATAGAQAVCYPTERGMTSTTSDRLKTAIASCIASNGGIVDARQLFNGNLTIDSQVDVGNAAGVPITLLLPVMNTAWTVTINDNSKCAFKVFDGSSIISEGNADNPFKIKAAVTANVKALVCTDETVQSTWRVEGFTLSNADQGTVTSLFLITSAKDGSVIDHMKFTSFTGKGIDFAAIGTQNVCCIGVYNTWVIGDQGSSPVFMRGNPWAVSRINWYGGTIVFNTTGSGAGTNIELDGSGGAVPPYVSDINFYGQNIENYNASATKPIIRVYDARHVAFWGVKANVFNGGNPWAVEFGQSGSNRSYGNAVYEMRTNSTNWINDTIAVTTRTGTSNNVMEKYRQCGSANTLPCQ